MGAHDTPAHARSKNLPKHRLLHSRFEAPRRNRGTRATVRADRSSRSRSGGPVSAGGYQREGVGRRSSLRLHGLVQREGRSPLGTRSRWKPQRDRRFASRRLVLMTMPLLALLIWMQAGHPDTVRVLVLVNVSQPVTNISSADLRSIYVGQTTRWPSHRLIVPIVM